MCTSNLSKSSKVNPSAHDSRAAASRAESHGYVTPACLNSVMNELSSRNGDNDSIWVSRNRLL